MHPLSTIQSNPSHHLSYKNSCFLRLRSFIHSGEMLAENKNGDRGRIKWSIHCLPSWLSSSHCRIVLLLQLLLLLLALGKAQTFLSIFFWEYNLSPSSHSATHTHNSPSSQTRLSRLGNHCFLVLIYHLLLLHKQIVRKSLLTYSILQNWFRFVR